MTPIPGDFGVFVKGKKALYYMIHHTHPPSHASVLTILPFLIQHSLFFPHTHLHFAADRTGRDIWGPKAKKPTTASGLLVGLPRGTRQATRVTVMMDAQRRRSTTVPPDKPSPGRRSCLGGYAESPRCCTFCSG